MAFARLAIAAPAASHPHRLGLAPERVALARDSLRRDAVIFGAGIEVAVARFVEALR